MFPLAIFRKWFGNDDNDSQYGPVETYKNLSGRSGIKTYQRVPGGFAISFGPGDDYDYTLAEGQSQGNIDHLDNFLQQGWGANTFINRFMRQS